jgi:parallel beta-helix repeat protein
MSPLSRPAHLFTVVLALTALVATDAAAQVACGDTLVASVQLTADLDCPGTGLLVGADKITIDLNGFTLAGDGDVGDLGIDNGLGFDGVTIKNGTISDFDEGISIGGNAQKNVVSAVTIQFCNSDAIDLNDSDFTKVTKTTILNSVAGVQVGTDGTGNVVEKSVVLGAAEAGVQLQGSGNVVQKNTLTSNEIGVRVFGSGNRVLANVVYGSPNDGIAVLGGTGNEVSKNTLTGTLGDGVEVKNAPGTIVKKNVAAGSRENGIGVFTGSHGTVLEKNVARGGGTDGISVEAGSDGVRVDGNTADGNRSAGIFAGSTTTTVAKNSATANVGFGIRTNLGAIDGGGNAARANGDGNCQGFVCKE